MTVLSVLRKIKHPNVLQRIKYTDQAGVYYTPHNFRLNYRYTRAHRREGGEYISVSMSFGRHGDYTKYIVRIFKDTFSVEVEETRGTPHGFSMFPIAKAWDLRYNDYEEQLFQLSTVNDFRMFGVQEAQMCERIRNVYWGKNESTTA